jgi:hypothetical protein
LRPQPELPAIQVHRNAAVKLAGAPRRVALHRNKRGSDRQARSPQLWHSRAGTRCGKLIVRIIAIERAGGSF